MTSFIKSKLKASRDAIGKKDFATAHSAAQEVLLYEASNYNALVFSGLALLELGQNEKSEEAYVKATQASPDQVLAWQGLSKLYERTKQMGKYLDSLNHLMLLYAKGGDAPKCAETLQKIIEFQREHGSRTEIIKSLSLMLESSPIYGVLSSLPAPDMTRPTSTTTFATQLAIHNSLPLIEEIIALTEKDESVDLTKEIDRRRTRLGEGTLEQIKNNVGREIWSSSKLPSLYADVINHPSTSDDQRRSIESKLLRYKLSYLRTLDSSSPLRSSLRDELFEMARGSVLLDVEDETAWIIVIDNKDTYEPEDYDFDLLRRFMKLFPSSPLSLLLRGYMMYCDIPLAGGEEDTEGSEAELQDYEGAFQTALEGFENSQPHIIAHRLMADLYAGDKDYANTIKVAEAGLRLASSSESLWGTVLRKLKNAFNATIATALVHLYPPKYHPRALGVIETVLSQDSDNIACLLARGYVLRYAGEYSEARRLFSAVAKLLAAEDDTSLLKLEALEESAWCASRSGLYPEAIEELKSVMGTLDSLEGNEERKAQAWWRLGSTLWEQNEEGKIQAYGYFITSLKRSPSFAPAFTSLGVHYSEYADPPDPIRASKCFQKAVELDPREGEAARRLAEGFANEKEWDLVEVVARRTIEGEGGNEGDMKSGSAAAVARYKPVNAWAWKALGIVELNRNNYAPAIVSLQVGLRANNDDFQTWIRLGEAYAKSGRPVAALKALNRAHELAPDDWTCTFFIGEVHRQTGQYNHAISAFDEILGKRPEETGVLLALAESYLSQGQAEFNNGFLARSEFSFSSAIQAALHLFDSASGFRRLGWKVVADALFELSKFAQFEEAEEIRRAVIPVVRILSYELSASSSEPSIPGDFMISRIEAQLEDGLKGSIVSKLAVAAFQHRIRLCDDSYSKAAALYDLAVSLHSAVAFVQSDPGRQDIITDQVTGFLKLALREDPSNEMYWNALATIKFQSDSKIAQHCYIKALQLDPKSASIWTNLGLLYLYHGDTDLANQALYRAQILDPEYALAWVGQAFVAFSNEHFLEMDALLEHALSLSTPIPQAEYEYSYRVLKRQPDASNYLSTERLFLPYFALRRYCGQLSQDPSGLHLFALVCERLGQIELAEQLLAQAITLLEAAYEQTEDEETEQKFAIANLNIGRVRLAMSDYSGAVSAFAVVLGLLDAQNNPGPASSLIRTQARFGAGLATSKLGDLEGALAFFEGALEDIPEDCKDVKSHVAILLAQTLWAIGTEDAQEAAKDQILQCIGEDHENLAAITTLSAMGILSQNEELIQAALSEILEMPMDRRRALDAGKEVDQLLVFHHLNLGRAKAALQTLEDALKEEPSSTQIQNNLAEFFLQTGHLSSAQDILVNTSMNPATEARSSLHDRVRLSAIIEARTSYIHEQKDLDEQRAFAIQRLAEKAVILAPWERKNWKALSYVRSVTSHVIPVGAQ